MAEIIIKTRTCKEGVWCCYSPQMGLLAPTAAKGISALKKELVGTMEPTDSITIQSMDPLKF